IPDGEGRAQASAMFDGMRQRAREGSEMVERGTDATTAEWTELTGITDPEFHRRLFAISPRVTLDQVLSGDGGPTGHTGSPP
ncbi:MAG: hypothetical protein ACKOET_04305, partial [Verrucomicrobiota bacterium]